MQLLDAVQKGTRAPRQTPHHGLEHNGLVCSSANGLPITPAGHANGKSESIDPGSNWKVRPRRMLSQRPAGAGSV
eukprot:6601862-Prymnesium_polylepis.2